MSGLQSSKVILGFLVPCCSKPHGCSTISPSFQEMTWSAMFVFYRRRSSVQQTLRRKEIKTKMYFCCMDVIAYLQHCLLDLNFTKSQDMLMKGVIVLCRTFQLCPETWLVGTTSVWICRCSAIASIKSKRQVPDRSVRDWPCMHVYFLSKWEGMEIYLLYLGAYARLIQGTIFKRPT